MVLPIEFGTITIERDYVDLNGLPGEGDVTFAPPATTLLVSNVSKVAIVPKPRTVALVDGHLSVTLPLTSDPDITPAFTYAVTENVSGLRRTYNIEIPNELLPGPVNLGDLAPVGAVVTGTTALTKTVADALYAPIGTGGASTVDALTDATIIGKTIVKAVDATAVRVAIGAGTSSLALGTTSSTAKAGDYQPAAVNISDSTTTGRAVLTAATATAARTAIGAGTSNLALGTTSSTAKAGDYQPTAEQISNATTVGRDVLKAVDATAARTAIGAGTSSVAIGTASGTAADAAVVTTALAAKLQFLAIGGATVSGRIIIAPDSATYTAYGDKQTGDIVATLAP